MPVPGNYATLNMGTNYIATIPNAAFSTLNITYLFLDYNSISHIADFAFKGLESLKVLHLQHNRLVTLPNALKFFLVNLKELDISYNLIDGKKGPENKTTEGFTDGVMKVLGNRLNSFTFGDSFSLLHWPGSLTHLQQLKYLHMTGSIMKYLPPSSFSGFEHTLETLWIEHTQLRQMPLHIARMTHIKELHFDHNTVDHGDSVMVESVFRDIGDTLEVLSLKYDNLTKFPDSLKYLVNLKNLSLEGNQVKFLSDEAILELGNGNLTFLSLKSCGLKRVPGAMSNLSSVVVLDMSENDIRTIENNDLVNLPQLVFVSFRGNPLKFISHTAFHRLPSLTSLDLSDTRITQMPKAIQSLTGLQDLNLLHAPVDCTCDMFWVKRWFDLYGMRINITGQCETIAGRIQTYIEDRIPHCPDYSEDFVG